MDIDTSYESATSELELGDDGIDKSGDRTEKSNKEDNVVLNRNTTAIEQLQNNPTKKISRANVSKNKVKKSKRLVKKKRNNKQ